MNNRNYQANVGTASNPVSYLHEYAVAAIWEALHEPNRGDVYVRTSSGETSSNLKEDMERVDVPDERTAIAGFIPDLVIYDSSQRPIRAIEVVVSSPPNPDKKKRLANLGVELVEITVTSEKDIHEIFMSSIYPKVLEKGFEWDPPATTWNNLGKFTSGFAPHVDVINQGVVNYSWQDRNRQRQRDADRFIQNLLETLGSCSPEMRREFTLMMNQIRSNESLRPISRQNPKYDVLKSVDLAEG